MNYYTSQCYTQLIHALSLIESLLLNLNTNSCKAYSKLTSQPSKRKRLKENKQNQKLQMMIFSLEKPTYHHVVGTLLEIGYVAPSSIIFLQFSPSIV